MIGAFVTQSLFHILFRSHYIRKADEVLDKVRRWPQQLRLWRIRFANCMPYRTRVSSQLNLWVSDSALQLLVTGKEQPFW